MSLGFSFRQTAGFVVDPAGVEAITYSPATLYPQTFSVGDNEYTVGYVEPVAPSQPVANLTQIESGTRDRNDTIDPRLAGTFLMLNDYYADIRFDLPEAGTYDIRLACGDATYACKQFIRIYDGATLLATIANNVDVAGGHFLDANGDIYNAANWPSQNTPLTLTFTTGTCFIRYGGGGVGGTVADASTINHIEFIASGVPVAGLTGVNGGANTIQYGAGFTWAHVNFSPAPTAAKIEDIDCVDVTTSGGTPPALLDESIVPTPGVHLLIAQNGTQTASLSISLQAPDGYFSRLLVGEPELDAGSVVDFDIPAKDGDYIIHPTANFTTVNQKGKLKTSNIGSMLFIHISVDEENPAIGIARTYWVYTGSNGEVTKVIRAKFINAIGFKAKKFKANFL